MCEALERRWRKAVLAGNHSSDQQRIQRVALALGQRTPITLDQLSGHLPDVEPGGEQLLRQRKAEGPRAFDADPGGLDAVSEALDLVEPPSLTA